MAYWESYEYPEDAPKVKISFGPQRVGPPTIAWIGRLDKAVEPPRVGIEEEFSGPWNDEEHARQQMNAHADAFIARKKL